MSEAPRTLARVRRYRDLMAVFRACVDECEITRETIDLAAKYPARYSQKLLAPVPVKHLGDSMDALLGLLGLEIWVVKVQQAAADLPKRKYRVPQRSDQNRTSV